MCQPKCAMALLCVPTSIDRQVRVSGRFYLHAYPMAKTFPWVRLYLNQVKWHGVDMLSLCKIRVAALLLKVNGTLSAMRHWMVWIPLNGRPNCPIVTAMSECMAPPILALRNGRQRFTSPQPSRLWCPLSRGTTLLMGYCSVVVHWNWELPPAGNSKQ